jgi:hypothetical protein
LILLSTGGFVLGDVNDTAFFFFFFFFFFSLSSHVFPSAQVASYEERQSMKTAAALPSPFQKSEAPGSSSSSSTLGAEPITDGVIVGRAYNPETFIPLPVQICICAVSLSYTEDSVYPTKYMIVITEVCESIRLLSLLSHSFVQNLF